MASIEENAQNRVSAENVMQNSNKPYFNSNKAWLLKLAFGRMLITLLTFGIGRFWMATRLRRHYWSSVSIGGDTLEYTGKALELFIGFLFAAVVIALYLITANFSFAFLGIVLIENPAWAISLTLLTLFPFSYWAQYQARAYLLSRTRWRGVRFGLMSGAWGYMARAAGWSVLVLLSIGILYPLMQMRLASYVTNRARYGDLSFRQEGSWTPLLPRWLFVWASGAAFLGFILYHTTIEDRFAPEAVPPMGFKLLILAALGLAFMIARARYQSHAFNYLHSHKVLGGETRAAISLSAWPVFLIPFWGRTTVFLGAIIFALWMCILITIFALIFGLDISVLSAFLSGTFPGESDLATSDALVAVLVISLAFATALHHVGTVSPALAAITASIEIINLEATERAKQRKPDEEVEAGRFADAIGIGIGSTF